MPRTITMAALVNQHRPRLLRFVTAITCVPQSLECRTLRSGQNVVVQGDVGDEFFFILSGSVSVTIRTRSPGGSDVDSHIAALEAGHHFGDLALMGPAGATRRATVTCRQESAFAVLRRSAYDQCDLAAAAARCGPVCTRRNNPVATHALRQYRFIRGKNSAVARERMALLSTVTLLRDLPEATLNALALVCTPHTYAPNAVVINQGVEAEELLVVASGQIKLVRELPKRDGAFGRCDFLAQKGGRPDPNVRAPNPKYAHVVSPVQRYRAQEPDSAAKRAEQKANLASGKAKARAAAAVPLSRGLAMSCARRSAHVQPVAMRSHGRWTARIGGAVYARAAVQVQRAIDKLAFARQSGLATIMKKAVNITASSSAMRIDEDLAKVFQYATRCERGDRIFLEARCRPRWCSGRAARAFAVVCHQFGRMRCRLQQRRQVTTFASSA